MNFSFLFKESLTALLHSPVRTFLTMLGVIIGVAAVIAMMSIGGGAQQETVRQIQSLGASNIYIKASRLSGESFQQARQALSEGLNLKDLFVILEKIPQIEGGTFEIDTKKELRYGKEEPKVNLIGVGREYFDLIPVKLFFGRLFTMNDFEYASKVCLLGSAVSKELFGNTSPVGKIVKISDKSFTIIGVLDNEKKKSKVAKGGEDIKVGDRERARDVYIPANAIKHHFPLFLKTSDNSEDDPTYSELSMVILKLKNPEDMIFVRDYLKKILKVRHKGINDYEIIAPVDLLEKSNKVQEIFNLVMIFIASLSLLVGGIGIMNIMLANIQQRVKEIGIRRAIGATKEDVLLQFLFESVVISVGGGILGVLSGIAISFAISNMTGWVTVISSSAIIVSFLVSVGIGLVFGIFPAKSASELDPISALRYE